jgi:hypothetical protein
VHVLESVATLCRLQAGPVTWAATQASAAMPDRWERAITAGLTVTQAPSLGPLPRPAQPRRTAGSGVTFLWARWSPAEGLQAAIPTVLFSQLGLPAGAVLATQVQPAPGSS